MGKFERFIEFKEDCTCKVEMLREVKEGVA